ncbi:M24 family metallopeptidase [Rhizobium sp. FKY42]|uniref:M24 family metallopeptidase n=1 Tax=Rhizobium sp. FKY42 TaxID=2562310 RepID=UPI0014856C2A|nr:M24 family metallopeptidase [Rhizobium sp. FKY42]
MTFTTMERDRRWAAARRIMASQNAEVMIGVSDLGDIRGHQRYLSSFRSTFDDLVTLVFSEGESALIVGHPAVGVFAKDLSWVTTPVTPQAPDGHALPPSVGGALANILKARGVTRIGVAGLERFPLGWRDIILSVLPQASFIELGPALMRERLVKSAEELAIIREAARISDLAWRAMPDLVRPGRKRYEVMADIEHILRSNGCEDNYALFEALPLIPAIKDRRPYSALPIQQGEVFCVEVSPRYLGYYAQQTGLVAVGGPVPDDLRAAYAGINRAREAGLKVMRAGVDITEVAAAVTAQLEKDGLKSAGPVIGHFVGLELEEMRVGHEPLILEDGMTFIFHPFAAGYPALLRADTYLVTASGAERLTSGSIEPLVI